MQAVALIGLLGVLGVLIGVPAVISLRLNETTPLSTASDRPVVMILVGSLLTYVVGQSISATERAAVKREEDR
jgi:hypothetical protein